MTSKNKKDPHKPLDSLSQLVPVCFMLTIMIGTNNDNHKNNYVNDNHNHKNNYDDENDDGAIIRVRPPAAMAAWDVLPL